MNYKEYERATDKKWAEIMNYPIRDRKKDSALKSLDGFIQLNKEYREIVEFYKQNSEKELETMSEDQELKEVMKEKILEMQKEIEALEKKIVPTGGGETFLPL